MRARDKEAELTAYCGLYCGDCLRYASNIPDLARDLKGKLVKAKFSDYASVKKSQVKEFGHYEDFLRVLEAITKLKCDRPCRAGGDGCSQPCEIKRCVQSRNYAGCWECSELERCGEFEFLKPLHGDAPRENARKVKEFGLNKWATHRSKFYSWL